MKSPASLSHLGFNDPNLSKKNSCRSKLFLSERYFFSLKIALLLLMLLLLLLARLAFFLLKWSCRTRRKRDTHLDQLYWMENVRNRMEIIPAAGRETRSDRIGSSSKSCFWTRTMVLGISEGTQEVIRASDNLRARDIYILVRSVDLVSWSWST